MFKVLLLFTSIQSNCRVKEWEMFKLKPKKKDEPAPVYKFVPLKPNPALAMAPLGQSASSTKVFFLY